MSNQSKADEKDLLCSDNHKIQACLKYSDTNLAYVTFDARGKKIHVLAKYLARSKIFTEWLLSARKNCPTTWDEIRPYLINHTATEVQN